MRSNVKPAGMSWTFMPIMLSTGYLQKSTPLIMGVTGATVLVVIAADPFKIIPHSYTCVPWSDDAVTVPLNFKIGSASAWVLLNMVLFCTTFFAGFIKRLWLFWTWDKTFFAKAASAGLSTSSPIGASPLEDQHDDHFDHLAQYASLWTVAFGGEFAVTVLSYTSLMFSFAHISYLITMVVSRGCVVLFLVWLKGRNLPTHSYTKL